MDIDELKPGTVISGKQWNEPIDVKKVERLDKYVRIVGSTVRSGSHIDALLPIEELSSISVQQIESDFSSKPEHVFLAFETKRYRLASIYDPLLAINISKVDPLPHQIEAVYGYILKLPRIRFLIADDAGAGKTIMAGLIIKELKLRNLIRRILIISPGHLKDQWRRELKDRFEENFVVVDRNTMDAHYGENVWDKENQIITSIDFAKQEEILPTLSSSHFELVIVDEAHKMSAYLYGDKTSKTKRYRLGEAISRNSDNLLFLTATPHKGDPENFRLFLDLLIPGFFATNEMLQESIRSGDNPLFVKRTKEKLKDFEGRPIFLTRKVDTPILKLSEPEVDLYNDVSRYVETQYNRALSRDKRRNVAFALVILQRRLASSTFALLRSLERRKARLEALEEESDLRARNELKEIDFEEAEDLSEEDRWKEESIWETLSLAENRDELNKEIQVLGGLIDKAKVVLESEDEEKLKQLKTTLKNLNEKFPSEKVIIFTESRETLEYLERKIRLWGYSVNTIHGGMKLEQRVSAEKTFKNETQILVATEAAGEGINLQFCHLMINYDLPWNPNRLEQRMGRIHRYGQTKEVFVFNLVAANTREGQVMTRVFEKLKEMGDALGPDKVFDVIGEVFTGVNLSQLMMDAAANARDINQILKEIDIKVDADYISRVRENLGESLATKYIDYTRIKDMADRAKEYKLIPEYTEAFFRKAFLLAGGKIRERKDGFFSIESVPYDLRAISDEEEFKRKFGHLSRQYPKFAFSKDQASGAADSELLSFGHPLFEAILEFVERKFGQELKKGAVFIDPEGKLDGHILLYEGEIKDGLGNIVGKRLFPVYVNEKEIKQLPPTVLWDLVGGEKDETPANLEKLQDKALSAVIENVSDYHKEKLAEREREAKIKEKYGVKSLEYFLVHFDGDLIELNRRKGEGENVDLVIRNKEEQWNRYRVALGKLKDQIERERKLTIGMPKFIGIIKVKPIEKVSDYMKRDEEIEKIGMAVAMKYEEEKGRTPENVSLENLGFDIRSTDVQGKKRYIEVKARAESGGVALTQNEWFKAKRFGTEYYLYVVFNCARTPELLMVQNPAEVLKPEEKIESVRFLVSMEQIKSKGLNE